MTKHGISHDYDLHANLEVSANNQTCIVCETSPVMYRWSDYSGQAMCSACGCSYQLKWGSDEQQKEDNYPYLRLKKEWIAVLKRYHQETKRFTYLGVQLGGTPENLPAFYKWVDEHYPDGIPEGESDAK